MTAPTVRTDYEALARLAQSFGAQAATSGQTLQQIRAQMDTLQGGDWIGTGASAFYREMSSDVLPSLTRLTRALEAGSRTVTQISQIMKTAEDEAARQLHGQNGSGGGAGVPGGAGAEGPGGGGGPGTGGDGGQPGGGGGPSAGGTAAGDDRSLLGRFADWFGDKAEWKPDGAKGLEFNFKKGNTDSPFSPEVGLKYGVEGSAFGDAEASDGWAAVGGGLGAKVGIAKDGPIAALYAEAYGFKATGDTLFAGDKDLGFTGAGEFKALSGDAVAGFKDWTLGASAGVNLASVKGELGANVAGINVGVGAEVGLKAEIGFQIGKKTEIKLPFITLGLSFGGAKD